MITITDQFNHTFRIIRSRSDQSRFSVSQRLHRIIKMRYVMCSQCHCFCRTFIICRCMSQRYLYFTLHFPDKFHRTADIRCQRYQFNPSTGYFIQFPYKICIRFRDPFFDMCALLNRIQKRSFHIDTCNRCSIAGLFCFPDPFKNLLKLFLRKCHGSRTI